MSVPLAFFRSLLLCLAFGATLVQAEVFVVVHRDNVVSGLDAEYLAKLYLGRSRTFPDGEVAVLIDQRDQDPAREVFFRRLLGMTLSQANAYWARLMFTGRVSPPLVRNGDAAVLAAIRDNPLAIGYVGSPPADDLLKVVLHLSN